MKRLAIFASGNGGNFEDITKYQNDIYFVCLLICDKENAYVIERAKKLNIPYKVFNLKSYENKTAYEEAILACLQENQIDFIALAGYMKIITNVLLNAYLNKIINIHPSLLPAFRGKDAILQAYEYGVKVTGVTIHYVDNDVDTWKIIAQESVQVLNNMTLEELESKIHQVEHEMYKKVLEKLLREV